MLVEFFKMTPIPTEFEGTRDQRGFKFKLLKRTGDICLFEKQKNRATTYEVVILRKVAEKTFPNGITTPAHESMPSPEEWGTSGWSYPILEKAEQKFWSIAL